MMDRTPRAGIRELWALAPGALTFVLLLLGFAPTGIAALAAVAPMLVILAVYYWSLYRPQSMPAWLAFVVGVFYDALAGGPIGLMALVLVATHNLCVSQRRLLVNRSFAIHWWGFAVVASVAGAVLWLGISFYHIRIHSFWPVVLQIALATALYPGLTWLFNRTEQLMPRET